MGKPGGCKRNKAEGESPGLLLCTFTKQTDKRGKEKKWRTGDMGNLEKEEKKQRGGEQGGKRETEKGSAMKEGEPRLSRGTW